MIFSFQGWKNRNTISNMAKNMVAMGLVDISSLVLRRLMDHNGLVFVDNMTWKIELKKSDFHFETQCSVMFFLFSAGLWPKLGRSE